MTTQYQDHSGLARGDIGHRLPERQAEVLTVDAEHVA